MENELKQTLITAGSKSNKNNSNNSSSFVAPNPTPLSMGNGNQNTAPSFPTNKPATKQLLNPFKLAPSLSKTKNHDHQSNTLPPKPTSSTTIATTTADEVISLCDDDDWDDVAANIDLDQVSNSIARYLTSLKVICNFSMLLRNRTAAHQESIMTLRS